MNKNHLIGFAVMAVGGVLAIKFLIGMISTIVSLALFAGAAYFGYKYFLAK